MKRVLVAVVVLGCSRPEKAVTPIDKGAGAGAEAYAVPSPGPNGRPGLKPGAGASPTGDLVTPTPGGDPGLTAGSAANVVIVAKIVDAGPIGDGRCSQRSYQVAVEETLAGAAPSSPVWVHFEQCGERTSAPAAGNVAGTSLATGTRYRLTLVPGGSKSFGDGLMIVDARTP